MTKLKNVNELKTTKMSKEEILINEYGCEDLDDLKRCFLDNKESLKMILDSMELYAQDQVNVTLGSVSKKELEEQKKIAYDKGFYDGCDHAAPSF